MASSRTSEGVGSVIEEEKSEASETDSEETAEVPLPVDEKDTMEEAELALADVRSALESVGRVINVLVSEFQRLEKLVAGDDDSVVHGCPPDGSGLTPCCHRSPIDLPLTERISLDGSEVTCKGAAAQD